MLTAIIAGILLFLFGVLIKGVFAHAMVILVAWLAKNGLLLAFLRTRFGRRVVRNVRFKTYSQVGSGSGRRRAYHVFKRMAGAERGTVRILTRVRDGIVLILWGPKAVRKPSSAPRSGTTPRIAASPTTPPIRKQSPRP